MDVKEVDGSYDKYSDKLRCAIENDLFGLSQDLRKQYISPFWKALNQYLSLMKVQFSMNWIKKTVNAGMMRKPGK